MWVEGGAERRGHRGGGVGTGVEGGGGGGISVGGDLDLDLEADLQAHRTPGVEYNGVADDSAYLPAMPCDALPGPRRVLPTCPLGRRVGLRPASRAGRRRSSPRPRPQSSTDWAPPCLRVADVDSSLCQGGWAPRRMHPQGVRGDGVEREGGRAVKRVWREGERGTWSPAVHPQVPCRCTWEPRWGGGHGDAQPPQPH